MIGNRVGTVARLVAVLVVVLGGLVGAAPAQAAETGRILLAPGTAINLATGEVSAAAALPAPLCGSSRICFYDLTIGLSTYYAVSSSTRGCRDLPASIDNKTSYIVNTSSAGWYVYVTGGCLGDSSYIYPNSRGVMNSDWNNKISAVKHA